MGGLAYLHAYQALSDAGRPVFAVLGDPNSSATRDVVPALRKLAAAEKAFDKVLRTLSVPDGARADLSTLLSEHSSLMARLDVAVAATSAADLNAAMPNVNAAGQSALTGEYKLGDDLAVFTDRPTQHLAEASLPVVVADLSTRPISIEGTKNYGASYIPSGYEQVAPTGGQVSERNTTRLQLADTSVSTTTVVAGSPGGAGSAAATFIICRSSGTGTTAGTEYLLGYNIAGGVFIGRVGIGSTQYLLTSSSDAAKAGATVELRADCVGSYLTLYVNGVPAIQVYDDHLASGNVGLSSSGPGATVYSSFSASGAAA